MYLTRTNNLKLKSNFKFKENYTKCPKNGCLDEDTQTHLFTSSCFQSDFTQNSKYDDRFSDNLSLKENILLLY